MIQSKYEYSTELGIKAGQMAYKLRSKKKELLINIFVPIAILLMIGILIFDVNKGSNIVLDIVLLILLAIIEIMNIFMPYMIAQSQKKYLKHIQSLNYDYYISELNKNVFKEKIYKDNKMIYANEIKAARLVNYAEFEHYVLVVFDNFASIIFDTERMQQGTKEELINTVKIIMFENLNKRVKKK